MTVWPANLEILTILLFLERFANIEHHTIQAKHVVFPYSSPFLLKTGLCSEVTCSLPHWVWLQGVPFSETATENLCSTHADRSCPCHMESPFSIWGGSISLYSKKLAEQVFALFFLPSWKYWLQVFKRWQQIRDLMWASHEKTVVIFLVLHWRWEKSLLFPDHTRFS